MGLKSMGTRMRLFIDPSLCTNCRICEVICSMTKEGGEVNPLKSRIRVVNTYYFNMAVTCRFCEKAPCVKACPKNALIQDDTTGVIKVDEQKCIGCDWCIQACPFGAVVTHPEKMIVICDLCEGEIKCAKHCPTKAIELLPDSSLAYRKKREVVLKRFS